MGCPTSPGPTCCGYTRVVRPLVGFRGHGDPSLRRGGPFCALPVLPPLRLPGHRLPRGRRRPGHPPQAVVRGLRPAVHHGRGSRAGRRQAQRGHRAVQPREGRQRRPAGLPGPSGRRGRPPAARPPRRGGRQGGRHRGDPQPRGGPGDPRARCGSSTRWPTSGSRASTGPSPPSRTSRRRSPTCADPARPRRTDRPQPAPPGPTTPPPAPPSPPARTARHRDADGAPARRRARRGRA